jgi:hypothetical protein
LEELEMDRFVVDDDPVKIENNRAKHKTGLQKTPFISTEYALEGKYGIST